MKYSIKKTTFKSKEYIILKVHINSKYSKMFDVNFQIVHKFNKRK